MWTVRLASASWGPTYQTDISQTVSGTVNLSKAHVNGPPDTCLVGEQLAWRLPRQSKRKKIFLHKERDNSHHHPPCINRKFPTASWIQTQSMTSHSSLNHPDRPNRERTTPTPYIEVSFIVHLHQQMIFTGKLHNTQKESTKIKQKQVIQTENRVHE